MFLTEPVLLLPFKLSKLVTYKVKPVLLTAVSVPYVKHTLVSTHLLTLVAIPSWLQTEHWAWPVAASVKTQSHCVFCPVLELFISLIHIFINIFVYFKTEAQCVSLNLCLLLVTKCYKKSLSSLIYFVVHSEPKILRLVFLAYFYQQTSLLMSVLSPVPLEQESFTA